MKKNIILLLFVLLSFQLYSQTKNKCSDVKTGVFLMIDNLTDTTIIDRTAKFQIETNKKGNHQAKYDVVWTGKCTYELKNKQLIRGFLYLSEKSTDVFTVKILKIKDSLINVLISSNISKFKFNAEMLIVK